MRHTDIDDERIAALLDGRVEGEDRRALLAELAEADEDYRVFADAAAILREREEEATTAQQTQAAEPAQVVPIGTRARRRIMPWAALAAVLAGAALVPVLRLATAVSLDPAAVAGRLSPAAARLPAGWTDHIPWGTHRGADGPPASDPAQAARLGALLVDLEVAVRSGDHQAVGVDAARVSHVLGDVPGGGILSPTYDAVRANPAQPADSLRASVKEGREGIAQLVDRDWLEAGAWAEGARLAAAAHDAAFFDRRRTGKALERTAALPGISDTAKAALARVRSALPAGDAPPDWNALGGAANDLLAALGR
jgi:hypothetical protein